MHIHLHLARKLMAWGLGIMVLAPFVLCLEPLASPRKPPDLPSVAGRVTYFGRPITDMYICLDLGQAHSALGLLQPDGSFRIVHVNSGRPGALPGQYHAHISSPLNGPSLPARYQDSRTSGLEIDVESDWSYFNIDLY